MRELCSVTVNGETFSAYRGDVLLDTALINGVDIPHDCRSGQCGTCRVHVLEGEVEGAADNEPNVVRACQSRIVSDVAVVFEETPAISVCSGVVRSLDWRAQDVVEICVEPSRPMALLPGQYMHVQFRGFPARCYSPTVAFDLPDDGRFLRFHVRRFADGQVSSAIGREIVPGHRVRLSGPFGSAYLRAGLSNRLVLVSGGTGFAPIWAIADAALRENPYRSIVAIVGARSLAALYMIPALCHLATGPNVNLVPVIEERCSEASVIRSGRPTDFLPQLNADDIVYAAGVPAMVDVVTKAAALSGALCHADPFEPAEIEGGSWVAGAITRLRDDFPGMIGWRPNQSTR